MPEQWYDIKGIEGHCGAGKGRDVHLHIFSSNMADVLQRYKKIPRIKSHKLPHVIMAMSLEEGSKLEKQIIAEGRVDLNHAKKTYYLSPESHQMICNSY